MVPSTLTTTTHNRAASTPHQEIYFAPFSHGVLGNSLLHEVIEVIKSLIKKLKTPSFWEISVNTNFNHLPEYIIFVQTPPHKYLTLI